MIYLIVFFLLMFMIVVKIEKKIISSKYLIKKAHKYRHATREERVERRKEIEEYKKSLTHKYYLDRGLKDPEIKKMLDKNKYKSLDAFRYEARLFYYGFIISILFGFTFTVTGLYKDEFISSLYPYIQPYFKVFYLNFEKYTFNPLSFKVCFAWVVVFSVSLCIFYLTSIFLNISRFKATLRKFSFELNEQKISISFFFAGLISLLLIYHLFHDLSPGFYIKRILYSFPLSFGIYFILVQGIATSIFLLTVLCIVYTRNIKRFLEGKGNANIEK